MKLTGKIKIYHKKDKDVRLGYMVLFDEKDRESSSVIGRMCTAATWAGGRYSYDKSNFKEIEIDNLPRDGFKIQQSISRHSTDNKVWRVLDPCGVTFEITSANLEQIISDCIIEKGDIYGTFVWAATTGYAILLNVDSEEYKSMEQALGEPEPTIGTIKPGYVVEVTHGERYQYIGKVTSDEKRGNWHAFVMTEDSKWGSGSLNLCKSKKMLRVISRDEKTTEEMIEHFHSVKNKWEKSRIYEYKPSKNNTKEKT